MFITSFILLYTILVRRRELSARARTLDYPYYRYRLIVIVTVDALSLLLTNILHVR